MPDKFVFFSKLVRQKKLIGWAKKYMHVCGWDMCWRNFCNFPWWLENVRSRSKIALFSNEHHFEIWFSKRKQLHFSEVNYLNYTKKTQFCMWQLYTFSLKQGETRTNSVPIPHPLNVWLAQRGAGKNLRIPNSSKCADHCFIHILIPPTRHVGLSNNAVLLWLLQAGETVIPNRSYCATQ